MSQAHIQELENALRRETNKRDTAEQFLETTRTRFREAKAAVSAAAATKDKDMMTVATRTLDALEQERASSKGRYYEAEANIRDIENTLADIRSGALQPAPASPENKDSQDAHQEVVTEND